MKYIIMADGGGTRWNNYMGIPKHLVEIDGEPLLGHTVRLLRELTSTCEAAPSTCEAAPEKKAAGDALSGSAYTASAETEPAEIRPAETEPIDIIITSHDERYEFEGARRYEPQNNHYEIDRFTEELIEDDICFLYGDTIYTEDVLRQIICTETDDLLFFGNEKSIIAVKVRDGSMFREHFDRVRNMFIRGEITKCKGWQLYQSVTGQDLQEPPVRGDKFITVRKDNTDINTPEEYQEAIDNK